MRCKLVEIGKEIPDLTLISEIENIKKNTTK
jgi:hypothetical protein